MLKKNRLDIARGIELLRDNDLTSENGVVRSQIEMHELSRHAIHTSETLQVAARNVEAALHHFEAHLSASSPLRKSPTTLDVLAGIHTSAGQLASLKLRADSFVKRLENEIQLVRRLSLSYLYVFRTACLRWLLLIPMFTTENVALLTELT